MLSVALPVTSSESTSATSALLAGEVIVTTGFTSSVKPLGGTMTTVAVTGAPMSMPPLGLESETVNVLATVVVALALMGMSTCCTVSTTVKFTGTLTCAAY